MMKKEARPMTEKQQKPSIGRVLIFTQPDDEGPVNQHRDHPCMVTRVIDDDTVNVKVFFDHGEIEDRPECKFSEGRVAWPPRV